MATRFKFYPEKERFFLHGHSKRPLPNFHSNLGYAPVPKALTVILIGLACLQRGNAVRPNQSVRTDSRRRGGSPEKNLATAIRRRKNGCWTVKNHRNPLEVLCSVEQLGTTVAPEALFYLEELELYYKGCLPNI